MKIQDVEETFRNRACYNELNRAYSLERLVEPTAARRPGPDSERAEGEYSPGLLVRAQQY